jgi:phage N-6-adenine-methyltransferase
VTISPALFSSATDNHATPQDLFDQLHAEFNFTLDVAASKDNHKCERWFGPDQDADLCRDGLFMPWVGRVWCNPPYGRDIKRWVEKAWTETLVGNAELVVMLLPARTDTAWFHDWCLHETELRFIRGRLKFGDATNSAPFPSMLVIWRRPVATEPYQMVTVRT